MNWLSLSIIALGLILGYSKHRRQTVRFTSPVHPDKTEITGKNKPEEPWRSDNLDDMIDASKVPLDPIHRNILLTKIIENTYKQRKDVRMKKTFKRFARIHLDEIPTLAPMLKSKHGDSLPNIPTFKLSAIVFEEEENYAAAIAVCKMALEYGIDDGTKSGFKGRLKRLQKKQKAVQS
jgi:hypothetical protein